MRVGAVMNTDSKTHSPSEALVRRLAAQRRAAIAEVQAIARETSLDVVLLRFDPFRGASFDILDHASLFWRCHHVAWRRRDGDLWLIPGVGCDGFVRAGAWSLEYAVEPPFVSNSERYAGIIRAIDNPSFGGRI